MALELIIVLLLVLLNGVFATAELAIVSARRARLERAARGGDKGAAAALQLAEEPSRFLSTVQIGITLVGVMAGAFGGATVSDNLARYLAGSPSLAPYAQPLAIGIVVLGITYLTLILGELVPKRLALSRPEALARRLALTMQRLSKLAAPLVWVLTKSTDFVLWVLPFASPSDPLVTDEEVKHLMREGTEAGQFHPAERTIVEMALRLGDRRVSALMIPRPQVEALDLEDPPEMWKQQILEAPYSHFPVVEGGFETVVGVVHVRDIATALLTGGSFDLKALTQPALFIPENAPALKALESFRLSHSAIGFIVDEYGDFQGLVTLDDILTSLLPDSGTAEPEEDPAVVQREDGSWLIDGMLPIDELADTLGLGHLPDAEELRPYQTLAGFIMAELRRIPQAGDSFDFHGFRFEVVDMDGRRVDKVLVRRPEPQPQALSA